MIGILSVRGHESNPELEDLLKNEALAEMNGIKAQY